MSISAARPWQSYQFNRFQGTIVLGASATPPSGEVPSTAVVPGTALVKFGPLTLPANDYIGGVVASMDSSAWAQNTQVLAKALDANITDIQLDATPWDDDPVLGFPTLRLQITFTALPAEVDIHVEVKHSSTR